MDVYGLSTPDALGNIDYLLDFSNNEIFTSSTPTSTTVATTNSDGIHCHFPYSDNNSAGTAGYPDTLNPDNSSTDFTDDLGLPNDDIKELEWLSNFVDDSFAEFPANSIIGTMNVCSERPLSSRSRSKRFRSTAWTSAYESAATQSSKTNSETEVSNSKKKDQNSTLISGRERSASSTETMPRKCMHCASEKTPQWRTGPLGPKTLCNACGVRYKSGRLVPEYRPAASPTFVLTQHSNSHRKVLELRRQKGLLREQQQQQQQQQQDLYGHQHRHSQVC